MKILWFISSSIIILTSCSNFICRNAPTESLAIRKPMFGANVSVNVRKFKARINFKTSEMTGIIICKKISDSTSAGSFINEFGIKGFDFSITGSRAKLGYTFKKLDKWYIRRTLENDLHFMFYVPTLNKVCFVNDSLAYVANISHKLNYVYYITVDNKTEHADMFKGSRKTSSLQKYYDDMLDLVLKMRHVNGSLNYEFYEIKN